MRPRGFICAGDKFSEAIVKNLYVGESGRNTYLHVAAERGYHPKIIQMLVNQGFSMNARNNEGYTPWGLWIKNFSKIAKNNYEKQNWAGTINNY